jgi:hypothetical protein
LKQLVPVGPSGETLLEYSVFDAVRAGFGQVVLVVRQETEAAFRQRLDAGMASRIPVSYVHQRLEVLPAVVELPEARARPWGTGQAVLVAGAAIEEPFAVINADDFYGAESFSVLHDFLTRPSAGGRRLAVLGFPVGETLTDAGPVSRALLEVDAGGTLREIVELLEVWRDGDRILYRNEQGREIRLSGEELVSMNMWGLTQQVVPALERCFADFLTRAGSVGDAEFILPEAIQSMVSKGRFQVEVLAGGGEWCGITFSQDRDRVRSIISSLVVRGCYPGGLWQ